MKMAKKEKKERKEEEKEKLFQKEKQVQQHRLRTVPDETD